MAVRISAGKMKGRKVRVCAVGEDLRPTSAKVRESLFNILGPRIKGSVFADLYAGSGAIGIEAMSRDAAAVYFVEAERKRASQIEDTLKGCGCRPRAIIRSMKADAFIRKAASEGKKFDIIFLDPPYGSEEMVPMLELLGKGEVLDAGSVVVAEHSSKTELPEAVGMLSRRKSYRYGDTSLTVMEKV